MPKKCSTFNNEVQTKRLQVYFPKKDVKTKLSVASKPSTLNGKIKPLLYSTSIMSCKLQPT